MNLPPWILAVVALAVLLYLLARKATPTDRETAPEDELLPVQSPDADGEAVRFSGAGLRLSQPAGFEAASTFEGFGQPATGASVMIVRINGPFADVSAGFNEAGLDSREMTLVSREERTQDGLPGVLLRVTQRARDVLYSKWLLAFGDGEQTFLVTATWPEERGAELSSPLLACVLSARRDAAPATVADAAADAPFTLSGGGDMVLAQTVGKSLMFMRDGQAVASPSDPLFVAAALVGTSGTDRNGFARQRITQMETVRGVTITAQAPLRVDDLDGVEIVARATDAKTGVALLVYQAVLFDGDHYFLMQGLTGTEAQRVYLPVFKTMARTFRRAQAR